MAGLFERIQNVFDDHFETERQQARQEGYQRALFETRDALLAAALDLKHAWQNQLVRDGDGVRNFTDAKYTAQLDTLNHAFQALRQMEPGIDTKLNIEQIRSTALAEAERERASRNTNGYSAAGPELDLAEYQNGYQFMRERLDRSLVRELNRLPAETEGPRAAAERRIVHDLAIEASRDVRNNWGDRGRGPERLSHPDFDLGQRKALMEWSHLHNHRLLEQIGVLKQGVQQPDDDAPRMAQRIRM